MRVEEALFKPEERAALRLRALYRRYGYVPFKMGKFEEYDLYGRNKDFLVSDGVITFTDTTGKLMALKPDVTLSIVNGYRPHAGAERVFYNENVYRVSDSTHRYKEILQTGLECLGELTPYHVGEVLMLAAESLFSIAEGCVLCVSHLGVAEALLDGAPTDVRRDVLRALSEKNAHGLAAVCEGAVSTEVRDALIYMAEAFGDAREVLPPLRAMTASPTVHAALDELSAAVAQASVSGCRVAVDLSLGGDMRYYNGLVFCGYIRDIPTPVLSGGQYDRLLARMHKDARAIGFAVYLDRLESLVEESPQDVDVVLLYDREDDAQAVAARVAALTAEGLRVLADTERPQHLRFGRIEYLKEDASHA